VPSEICDSLLNERGYPLNSPLSGTYVTEPQMSNLIREAIDIGFKLFPYYRFGEGRKEYEFDNTVLVLPKGRYRLEITDITGQQEIKEIEVE
jgi:hypothetical protein